MSSQNNTTRSGQSAGLRGSVWRDEEINFILERRAEDPTLGWTRLATLLNAHFQGVAGHVARTPEALRSQFRLEWPAIQRRLDAQRGFEGDGEEELSAEELREAGRVLFEAVDEVESSEEEVETEKADIGKGGFSKKGQEKQDKTGK